MQKQEKRTPMSRDKGVIMKAESVEDTLRQPDPKQELEKKVIEMYVENIQLNKIKFKFRIFDSRLYHILHKHNIPLRQKNINQKRGQKIIVYAKKHLDLSGTQIAQKFKMKPHYLYDILTKNNFKKPNSSTIKLEEKKPKILKLLKQGMLLKQIGRKLHVGITTITEIKNNANLSKITEKEKLFNFFKTHPDKIFNPIDLASVVRSTSIASALQFLYYENKIERVVRGQYRLKKRSKK